MSGDNKVVDDKDLVELSQENEIEVRGKKFEVAREVVPFEELFSRAEMMARSTIIPVQYQNRPENVYVALDMASRAGLAPMYVMQNLYIIQGKPSWSGQAISAMLKASPQFKNVELHYVGEPNTDEFGAFVTATKVSTGKVLTGGTVTIGTAKAEGWFQKRGSKWQTMPEIMLAYRAHAWFGRVYAPELLMGLQSTDEVEDVGRTETEVVNPYVVVED